VGDDVLREVARRLGACARRGDVAARVGGEELAWLLPGADLAHGMEAAERLRRVIAGTEFAIVGRLTASLGVASLGVASPGAADPEDLARRADRALYRAKEGGRDACVASDEGEDALMAARSG
jgi:diguanylate cyclase (GGDEF)-like protein